jgi:hypothetical protein
MVLMDSTTASSFEGVVSGIFPLAVAATVWFLEFRRRGADEAHHTTQSNGPSCGPLPLLRQCKPEVVGVGCVMTAAIGLLAQAWTGMTNASPQFTNDEYDAAWVEITQQWPVLMTADTLLALQSLLRLPLLLSVLLRSPTLGTTGPLTGVPTLLFFTGAACRVSLLTWDEAYWLDGPLGGNVNLASEVAALLVLTRLSWGVARTANMCGLMWSVCLAGGLASRHQLQISENSIMNTLFVMAQLLDLLAASAHLAHTWSTDGGPRGGAASFVHFLLPLQQALPVYFFLEAFDEIPELVSCGYPFKVLQLSTAVALGMYLMAAVLHIVLCVEGDFWQTLDTNDVRNVQRVGVGQTRSIVAI